MLLKIIFRLKIQKFIKKIFIYTKDGNLDNNPSMKLNQHNYFLNFFTFFISNNRLLETLNSLEDFYSD